MIDWLKRPIIDPEIELNGVTIPINLRRHHTAKRLTLRLAPDGSAVRITLPAWANSNEAIAFAHARRDWLAQQHGKVEKREAPKPGSAFFYRGEQLRVEWDDAESRCPTVQDGVFRVGGLRSGLERRIQNWLEKRALQHVELDMLDYTSAAGLKPVPVALSRAQRRWGSCSDKERIRINWRLIQAPDFVRRSVVAHEVAHLVHFDHSPAFHALLGDIYDADIKTADRWLKEQGRGLYTSFG